MIAALVSCLPPQIRSRLNRALRGVISRVRKREVRGEGWARLGMQTLRAGEGTRAKALMR
jgi:hypothetical protein